jgi:hypothetical protein
MHSKQSQIDALLTNRWQEFVEASLKLRGIDLWSKPEPYRFLQQSCKTEFSISRHDLVAYLKMHTVPVSLANADPQRCRSEGTHLYKVGDKWHYEYIEKATSCYVAEFGTEDEALEVLVKDCFPYITAL